MRWTCRPGDHYDFSDSVRGKYAKRFAEGPDVVLLEPEVAKVFPTSEAVNKALRQTLGAISLAVRRHKELSELDSNYPTLPGANT